MADPTPVPSRAGADDAICFTAGYRGLPFFTGLIHAWLAADRSPPGVAAGISSGALAAAAMQRACREAEAARAATGEGAVQRGEARRWRWFRRLLDAVSEEPFAVLWRAFPDPTDFSAGRPPVRDLSCPPELSRHEREARENYHLLIKLGRWVSGLPVAVRTLGAATVAWVRWKERYGGWAPLRGPIFVALVTKIALQVVLHLVRSPQFVNVGQFRERRPGPLNRLVPLGFRPLFGWTTWLSSLFIVAGLVYGFGVGALWVGIIASASAGAPPIGLVADLLSNLWPARLVAVKVLAFGVVGLVESYRRGVLEDGLHVRRGLLHDYHLERRLHELFREDFEADGAAADDGSPRVTADPMPILLVAAPLQDLRERLSKTLSNQQVWAATGTPLVEALRAAVAIPGLMPPVVVEGEEIEHWIDLSRIQEGKRIERLDLVDGSVIRKNPIPALFTFLRGERNRELADSLCSEGRETPPHVHVAYAVPVAPPPGEPDEPAVRPDIVDSAFVSLDLAACRDTQLERLQTNVLSDLEVAIRQGGGRGKVLPIFADDIAPERSIEFSNPLAPGREESLRVVAAGCRRTLGVLYQRELAARFFAGKTPCHHLIASVAPGRAPFVTPESPGLPEVCRHCTREVEAVGAPRPPEVLRTWGGPGVPARGELAARFPHLRGDRPRIVFVASGGVFRGATHVGVLAALWRCRIRPDLIVAASVGSLIGGALGAMSVLDQDDAEQAAHGTRILARLAESFLYVDEEVALTRTVKSAARQLGVRLRRVDLAPRRLSRSFRRGTRADPGFAAAGVPPSLIDAISELFLLPHQATVSIARQFVAGHFARATQMFLRGLQRETLRRLDIRYAVMGTSLLERRVRDLLGEGCGLRLDRPQPYSRGDRRASFFGTATALGRRHSILLGRDFLRPSTSYDFVKAALASSAFPAVFSPIREAEILPGIGSADELFADGGMFDNLPFFPAIEVLSSVQRDYRSASGLGSYESLQRRAAAPDLIFAASLDASPDLQSTGSFADRKAIKRRASSLQKNLKIASFDFVARKVSDQIGDLLAAYADRPSDLPPWVDGIVNAGVLRVIPTDDEHVNPTFAFCASVGFEVERVQLAIADGCFQTLGALAAAQASDDRDKPAIRSIALLTERGAISRISAAPAGESKRAAGADACPFYRIDGRAFSCPFAAIVTDRDGGGRVQGTYARCTADRAHRARDGRSAAAVTMEATHP